MSRYGIDHLRLTAQNSTLHADRGKILCDTEILQTHSGLTVALCRSDEPHFSAWVGNGNSISGRLGNGLPFEASIYRHQMQVLEAAGEVREGGVVAFGVERLEYGEWRDGVSAVFDLVNLMDFGQRLVVVHPLGSAEISAKEDYQARVDEVRATHEVRVTSKMTVKADSASDADNMADNICDLLSIAKGSRIQWICRKDFIDGNEVGGSFGQRVTKRYSPSTLIEAPMLAAYIAEVLPRLLGDHGWPIRHMLGSYFDTKNSGDFLEIRAIKIAACMESIKDSFLRLERHSGLICAAEKFDAVRGELQAAISGVLTNAGWTADQRRQAYRAVPALNRESFSEIFHRLIANIGSTLTNDDVAWFIRCRDTLLHTGDFYSADESRILGAPFNDRISEYFWLSHVLERIILRIFGYSGAYLDRRNPSIRTVALSA